MFIQILGSAAGGGFPQRNCNCVNCADIRAQLESFPKLQPARGPRDTAIGAIILLDSQIDHTTGLLTLREGCPHEVWCTEMVHQDLSTGFPLFKMLEHWNGGLRWNPIALEGSFTIATCPNLNITPIPLRSSAPPYSPHRNDPHPGDNIGLLIEDRKTGGTLFYAPGLGQVSPELLELMRSADCLLVDGTLWRDDEMRVREVGTKLGSEMGHLHQSGPGGMIEVLDGMPAARKILIHINNTNPILDEDSAERAVLDEHGIEVSFDGMSIEL